jgi:molybdenum cofactor cytidylyltransferase
MPTIIVLAAGASKRLGRPKQLLQFDGETLLERAIRIASEVESVIVVVGGGQPPPAVRTAEGGCPPQKLIINPNPEEGIASSIRVGVAATEGDVLLMLCDQPLITADHLRALIAAKSPIAATGYSGISGVPTFFAAKFRDELLALRGDVGAKQLIERHRDELVTIPFDDAALDVDTAADYNSGPFQRS